MSSREKIDPKKFSTGTPQKDNVSILDAVGPDGKGVKRNSYLCVAKYLVSEGKETRYYIKRQTIGQPGFFNPLDHEIDALSIKSSTSGRPKFEFFLVKEDAYINYVKFLNSKNAAYLRTAERYL